MQFIKFDLNNTGRKENFSNIKNDILKGLTRYFLVSFLLIFFLLSLSSANKESQTVDEIAHITAGYSYITEQTLQLNPEHPPLIKSLSGLFLLPLDLSFPYESQAWQNNINSQWDLGREFLYKSGNDVDKILFFSRLAPLILTILLLFFFFKLTEEFFGKKTALLALVLASLSPTILAHSHYVTTDIAAAFSFFIAIFLFLKFLKKPSKKNILIAGIFFGVAQCFKFSLLILIPFLLFIAFLWSLISKKENVIKDTFKYIFFTILIFLIGYVFVVWPIYKISSTGYTNTISQEEKTKLLNSEDCMELELTTGQSQHRNIYCLLQRTDNFQSLSQPLAEASKNTILSPYAQYALGALLTLDRASDKSPNFFLGNVSKEAHKTYFPVAYILKEPLSLHILSVIAIIFFLNSLKESIRFKQRKKDPKKILKKYFPEISSALFIVLYLYLSIQSSLNIGIRHLIPIYPFIFVLTSLGISKWLFSLPSFEFSQRPDMPEKLFSFYVQKISKFFVVFILILSYIIPVLFTYPNFLTYFNSLAGGPDKGYKYISDSNIDWGQGLKELAIFTEKNNIEKLQLDYFGTADPKYYLGDKYEPYGSYRGEPKGWFAVSIQYYTLATGEPKNGFQREEKDSYTWLKNKKPTAIVGNSILVYFFE